MSTLHDPHGQPLREVLIDDPRIQAAAFVAETFHMDPVVVLAAPRDLWRIRLAAAEARARANSPETAGPSIEG